MSPQELATADSSNKEAWSRERLTYEYPVVRGARRDLVCDLDYVQISGCARNERGQIFVGHAPIVMAATTDSHASLLLGLPQELLEQILLSPSLSVRDICHMSQTCRLFYSVVSRIWRKVSLTRFALWWKLTSHLK